MMSPRRRSQNRVKRPLSCRRHHERRRRRRNQATPPRISRSVIQVSRVRPHTLTVFVASPVHTAADNAGRS
jgi:transposase